MEKILQIDLVNENDLFEKYNRGIISKELIKYMIESTPYFRSSDSIKIVINNGINSVDECTSLIIEGLKNEYDYNIFKYHRNNLMQIALLIAGVIAIFISTLIDATIIKELVLIGGWVLIWEMVESEIFEDINNRKKIIILRKLLNSEIVENKV